MAQKVEPLSASLSDLERRVAFNVELAVNEIEDLTTGLSRKIWQKIMILQSGQ